MDNSSNVIMSVQAIIINIIIIVVAHLVVHVTSGSTSYETIPPVPSETSGGVLSTVDMVVQRRDGPRRLRDNDVEDDEQTKLHAIRASC